MIYLQITGKDLQPLIQRQFSTITLYFSVITLVLDNYTITLYLPNPCTSWVSFAYHLGASWHLDGGVVVRDRSLNFSHVGDNRILCS